MNIAFLLPLTVEDAVADLARAADALGDCRIRTAHVAADLETRWAANRAARIPPSGRRRANRRIFC